MTPADLPLREFPRCEGCGDPDDAREDHEAHVLLWQVGDRWVPCCADRALDWWDAVGVNGVADRKAADAPADWIRPLPDFPRKGRS